MAWRLVMRRLMRTNLLFLPLLVLGADCIIFSYMPRGPEIEMQKANWIAVEDYKFPGGWTNAGDSRGPAAHIWYAYWMPQLLCWTPKAIWAQRTASSTHS